MREGPDENAEFSQKFIRLFDQLQGSLISRIDRRLLRQIEISDVIQEAFLRALKDARAKAIRTDSELLAWLRAVCENIIISSIRKKAPITNFENSSRDFTALIIDVGAKSGSKTYSENTLRVIMGSAISLLSDQYRNVLVWHIFDNLGFKEIGARLGKSESASRGIYRNAKIALQGILMEWDICESDIL